MIDEETCNCMWSEEYGGYLSYRPSCPIHGDMADSVISLKLTPEPEAWFSFDEAMHTQFSCLKAPSRFHRFMTRWLLGIRWKVEE